MSRKTVEIANESAHAALLVCIASSAASVSLMPLARDALSKAGQCRTGTEPRRFISEVVETLMPSKAATALVPPSFSKRSGTVVMEVRYNNLETGVNSYALVQRKIFETDMAKARRMKPFERLVQAREAAGFKERKDATDRFGWNYSTYSTHETGFTPLSLKSAEKYAKAYKVPGGAAWLLTGAGQGPPRTAPVIGGVGVNGEVRFYQPDETDRVLIPPDLPATTVALAVECDSLYPLTPDWLVFYDASVQGIELGATYTVVTLADKRTFVKTLAPGSQPNLFHLLGMATTPMFDQEVKAAASVVLMRLR